MTSIKAIFGVLLAVVAAGASSGRASPDAASRHGAERLHVTKECSQNDGDAGDFCTITSSNINAIKPARTSSTPRPPVIRRPAS